MVDVAAAEADVPSPPALADPERRDPHEQRGADEAREHVEDRGLGPRCRPVAGDGDANRVLGGEPGQLQRLGRRLGAGQDVGVLGPAVGDPAAIAADPLAEQDRAGRDDGDRREDARQPVLEGAQLVAAPEHVRAGRRCRRRARG